ncbi:Sec14 cytosolic factor [Sparassis crispa]|uniref:Sec14 cytosolic factor n=1 Tax=Sparassis crispa TaxID=139825 RepID=A0A401GSW1_9APHY|nr:Sec14 cytosolic factor [Sparassis crispa]GBE85273.1 Sec14 cytosolic factor [Sparassis crispa]
MSSDEHDLHGHQGHLDAEQQAAFEHFEQLLASAGLYTAASDDEPASHDEPTLLRFLRARRFEPHKALRQFSDAHAWRAAHDVDRLYATFPPDEFESARRFYPRWTGRRDKNGLPLYVYRLAALDAVLQKELYAVPPARRYQRIVALYETMTNFILRLCSFLPHRTAPTPVSSVTTIIDLAHVSFSTMWALRSHLHESSALATANYPETLHTIAVVNSPAFFPTVWGWIKNWFDEGTRRKIHILGHEPGPALRQLIDPEHLPKSYGGDLDWNFEDEPALDQDAALVLGGAMPKGPAYFDDGRVRLPEHTPS